MRKLGANCFSTGNCEFSVWAPELDRMLLHLETPKEQTIEMEKATDGYFTKTVADIGAGATYRFGPNGMEKFPDPASHYQPEGVHGPSKIVDHNEYEWQYPAWTGLPLKNLIFYEIHVGTFTAEGTFEAIIPLLDELAETGINAIELMPVSQFPGTRNWGYDAVFPYAVQNSYGGPTKFKELIDAAHRKGIAVFLDVVFNHLGPEGNCFGHFGPYFTDTYHTPWGNAVNFDGTWSDGVREYFANAVLHWYENYHIDGLRVDAVHMMFDNGAVHFWELVNQNLEQHRQKLGRNFYLIAESDLNSPRVTKSAEDGGWGFNVQWLDDFHHSLYVLLDAEGRQRYEDFGELEQLAKAYTDGFVHSGEFVKFRKRKHGSSSVGVSGDNFIVFNQNHDQIGNRVGGERLSMLVDFERQKLAAAAILLSPYIPMLFMGEEFSASSPFFYFVSHSDPKLIRMVVEGRRKEFENYKWDADPPNPQEEETFEKSKLIWTQRNSGRHRLMLNWHKELIAVRRYHPVMQNFNKNDVRVTLFGKHGLALHRRSSDQQYELLCIFNLGSVQDSFMVPLRKSYWKKVLDSTDPEWLENGSGMSRNFPDSIFGGEVIDIGGPGIVVYEAVDTQI
jgi:maltooligosyltrehalose trehalohydrolase